MRIISWNVNGFRAALGKGFLDWLPSCGADVVMLQETKVEPDQLAPAERDPAGFTGIWNWSKGRKGYSGTACLAATPPQAHSFGLEQGQQGAVRGVQHIVRISLSPLHLNQKDPFQNIGYFLRMSTNISASEAYSSRIVIQAGGLMLEPKLLSLYLAALAAACARDCAWRWASPPRATRMCWRRGSGQPS